MLTPMRRNVLIDMGPPTLLSDTIVIPDFCQGIGMKGTVVAVGPLCRHPLRPGQQVIVNKTGDYERVFTPDDSADRFGLARHWHVMPHEDKVAMVVGERPEGA
jgi:NADPH:quinone reductase-like Zn-dependent oxidoreductase